MVFMPFAKENNAEKRDLAEKPVLVDENGNINADFFGDTDDYLSDNFGFRTNLVNALSKIKDKVFKTSAENEIIIGKKGWLFFEKTLNDFSREKTLSQSDLKRIAKTLDLIYEYVESKNAKMVFFIAPNKNTVYPKYMPYYYAKGGKNSNFENLNTVMKNKDYYINLLPLLKNNKEQIYHTLDSHWNNLGAAIGFNVVMNKFEKDAFDYLSCDNEIKSTHAGDLYKMLYPTGKKLDNQVVFNHKTSFEFTSRYKTEEDLVIKTKNKIKEGSLTMYRDSFCNALLPMFADEFSTAEFSRIFPYRLNLVDTNKSDYVVFELVERNIGNLLLSAPVMKAPERKGLELKEINGKIIGSKKSGNLLHIYGSVDSATDDIFLSVSGKDGNWIFEAFPIYESKLIDGQEAIKSGGFSAYIPFSNIDEIDIKICSLK